MNKKKLMSNGIAAVALLTLSAALAQLVGPVYGLGIAYLAGASFHKKVSDLVSTKVR